jgi:hypothetical protein
MASRKRPAADDVEFVGERTRQQRDDEGRKKAIDVDHKAKTELSTVDGLNELVANLSPGIQAAALKWCIDTDTSSVEVLVLLDKDDELMTALGLLSGGNNAALLRKRFATVREVLAGGRGDAGTSSKGGGGAGTSSEAPEVDHTVRVELLVAHQGKQRGQGKQELSEILIVTERALSVGQIMAKLHSVKGVDRA